MAGIGRPDAFFDGLVTHFGLPLLHRVALPDHDPWDAATVARLNAAMPGVRTVVVTEKDWVKLRRHEWLPWVIARAELGVDFADGDADALGERIDAALAPGSEPRV